MPRTISFVSKHEATFRAAESRLLRIIRAPGGPEWLSTHNMKEIVQAAGFPTRHCRIIRELLTKYHIIPNRKEISIDYEPSSNSLSRSARTLPRGPRGD